VPGMTSLDKAAAEVEAEQVFLQLLDRLTGQGRNVSDKASARNYAPLVFASEPEARKRFRRAQFESAMQRLFAANKIIVETYGPRSRGWTRLGRRP
jgi:RecA-family ATPase